MTRLISTLSRQEQFNFLVTNRIPRRLLTRMMGWYSRIESPWLTRISLFIWKLFDSELSFEDAKQTRFRSVHECFIRELKQDARPVDCREQIVTSPCDAIVGECGAIKDRTVFQAKGFPYELADLIPDARLQAKYQDGLFVTLRLKSSMYHHFHAPLDCHVSKITYISGDTWNVNPIALQRIEKLFCKNERAVVELGTDEPEHNITLVPVAAILVASMKFHALDTELDMKYRGASILHCDTHYKKGGDMGYFQHGSTIILFATSRYRLVEDIVPNHRIRMGQPLLIK